MKLRELVKHCKEINIECDVCMFRDNCENLSSTLEDISPVGLLEIVESSEREF